MALTNQHSSEMRLFSPSLRHTSKIQSFNSQGTSEKDTLMSCWTRHPGVGTTDFSVAHQHQHMGK